MALNPMQKAFVEEYYKHPLSAAAAAIAAGYAETTAQEASSWVREPTPNHPNKKYKAELAAAVKERGKVLLEQAENYARKQAEESGDRYLATPEDIMAFHSGVLSGKETEQQIVMVGTGNGYTRPEVVERTPTIKEKQMSANSLARIFGMEKTNLNVEGALPVLFVGEDSLEE